MGAHIFSVQIMAVIGGDQGNRKPPAHIQKRLVDVFLHIDAVVLDLQIKIVFAENFPIKPGRFIGLISILLS